jgi:hypothetical protein
MATKRQLPRPATETQDDDDNHDTGMNRELVDQWTPRCSWCRNRVVFLPMQIAHLSELLCIECDDDFQTDDDDGDEPDDDLDD